MCAVQPLPAWPSNGRSFANPQAFHQIVSGTGVQRDLGVALARREVRLEPEQLAPELDETLEDVVVAVGHAEPDPLRVQRPVTHEVTDELGDLGAHRARHARRAVGVPVQVAQRRQRDLVRLADERVEHHRHTVAGRDLGHPLPDPVALAVDDLDAVRRSALDAVAARGLHRDDLFLAVDVELRRVAWPLVGRDLDVEILPLRAICVAQAASRTSPRLVETSEPSTRQPVGASTVACALR